MIIDDDWKKVQTSLLSLSFSVFFSKALNIFQWTFTQPLDFLGESFVFELYALIKMKKTTKKICEKTDKHWLTMTLKIKQSKRKISIFSRFLKQLMMIIFDDILLHFWNRYEISFSLEIINFYHSLRFN